ncbi:hypothetical protein Goarm_020092 [Gossypium armourianum]|uniref:Uncharacterized protein n=1 Tax=Gossypium armourianum TaxID=34283 RepID=A0A7J9IQA2_9ROSI|nr:hypothetical protein [Gossypium armourianum]
MGLCKEIWHLDRYQWWERFWTIPQDKDVVPFVQEFYASLRDLKSRNTEGHMGDIVPVRGKEVREGEDDENDGSKEMDFEEGD